MFFVVLFHYNCDKNIYLQKQRHPNKMLVNEMS